MISIIDRIKQKVRKELSNMGYVKMPQLDKYIAKGDYVAVHISAFGNGNAGDLLLPVVLRDLFNQIIGVKKWYHRHVYKLFNRKDLSLCNKKDFIVIGGGGLFLADTNPNDISGWQWNCSVDMLQKIDKPIVVFAVGYNRFRGQAEFKPIFTEHINELVNKAVFVGLRNHGSIESIKRYLSTKELQDKVVYQPCMTTLISKIYPHLTDYSNKKNFIAFNCAFDRPSMRAANDSYLRSIAKVALTLSHMTEIRYYSHMESDKLALPYFDELGVNYSLVELNKVNKIVESYAQPRLVIGMRGHSQMIPFGCNTPILSIVSHDKMQWFLDDINHPEWGVDVNDLDFENKLIYKARTIYDSTAFVVEQLEKEQNRLYQITLNNMGKIRQLI